MTKHICELLAPLNYTFRALARLYYPQYQPETASRYMRRLLHGDPLLYGGLRSRGYHPKCRKLSPRQIAFIAEELGSPEEFALYSAH